MWDYWSPPLAYEKLKTGRLTVFLAHSSHWSAKGVPTAGKKICTWRDRTCSPWLWQEWRSQSIFLASLFAALCPSPLGFIRLCIKVCIQNKLCHFAVSFPHHQEGVGARSHERSHSTGIWYSPSLLSDYFNLVLFSAEFPHCGSTCTACSCLQSGTVVVCKWWT